MVNKVNECKYKNPLKKLSTKYTNTHISPELTKKLPGGGCKP